MKQIRLLSAIIAVILLIPHIYVGADFSFDAESSIVLVSNTNEIAYENNAHKRLPIASTTKIVTAIVVLENTDDIHKTVTIPKEACDIEGSSIYLYENEKITIEALLYGLLLNSGNDAATALAIKTAGSVESFVKLMNAFSEKLGLCDTSFTNPHGLNDENHYSSAYDLSQIMRYAMLNEDFAKIVSTKEIKFSSENGNARYFANHNKLLRIYEFANGGKTGFTKASGRCLVTSAKKDGVSLICVTLNASDDFNSHIEAYNYYFQKYHMYNIFHPDTFVLDVVGGVDDIVTAIEENEVCVPLCEEFDYSKLKKIVKANKILYAPISEGTCVGKVEYYYKGKLIYSNPLITLTSVNVKPKKNWFLKILEFIKKAVIKNE